MDSAKTSTQTPGAMIVAAVCFAALADAVASITVSVGHADITGDTHVAPDEFVWLDICYTGLKIFGFIVTPWLASQVALRRLLLAAALAMAAAAGLIATTISFEVLAALRAVEGFAGGVALVAGQTVLFLAYPRGTQPIVQAIFATAAVVAPATVAPALQGWVVDTQTWTWAFAAIVPIALLAVSFILLADERGAPGFPRRRLSGRALGLALVSTFSLSFVLSQGTRWNWFDTPMIVWLCVLGTGSLALFLANQRRRGEDALFDPYIFRSQDFTFAFAVSFVAGAALFGSAFLIPSFAGSVLNLTPTASGTLLAPSGASFVAGLLVAAVLIQRRSFPPIACAPLGVAAMMVSMWMLSGSTLESGPRDMALALLLRGLGLGLLFLAITLIAFSKITPSGLPSAVALFNVGRQLGGMLGVAGLQTLIQHNVAVSSAALRAHLASDAPSVAQRIAATASMLSERGVDSAASQDAALLLLNQEIRSQAMLIAYGVAFQTIALFFVAAAPLIVGLKIVQSRLIRNSNV